PTRRSSDLLVAQRPVFFDAVHRPFFEILRCVAEHYGIPMHGPAPHHAYSVHTHPIAVFIANRTGHVSLVEGRLLLAMKPAVRQFVRPLMREELGQWHFAP